MGIAELNARQAAFKKEREDWCVDHEAEPEIAGNAFLRGWDAAVASGSHRTEVPEPSAEKPDIEYRDSAESDNWALAVSSASVRDIEAARRENERLGWRKYRVLETVPEPEPQGELIAEVANAVRDAWQVRTMRPVDERPGLAETAAHAALAVFEKTHTPTDDERAIFEALADRLGEHPQATNHEIADSGEYETHLRGPINVEVLAEWLVPIAAGFRRSEVPEPSTEGWSAENRREALAEGLRRWSVQGQHDRLDQRDQDIYGQGARQGFALGAEWWKLTHSVPPEPQAEPSDVSPEAITEATHRGTFGHVWPCPLFYVGNWKKGEEHHYPVKECSNPAVCEAEPQAEPSDAQVIAAVNAHRSNRTLGDSTEQTSMRAALRAASAVAEQGENR